MRRTWRAASRRSIRALALDPTQKAYHNNAGIVHLDAGRPEEALASFRASVALDPNAFAARYNQAMALAALGRDSAAVRSLRRALKLAAGPEQERLARDLLEALGG